MKLRSLDEIERDEKMRGPIRARDVPLPVSTDDLQPGPAKRFLLGLGDVFIFIPKLLFKILVRLLAEGIALAVILGIVGCIVFGLVYLFG